MRTSYIISGYFARTFLLWFGVFLIGILSIVFLFDFSELLRRASTRTHISLPMIAQMAFLKLPFLVQHLLPFIVLFSSMFTLWRLNRSNEIVVIRAAGVSIWQMLAPFIVLGLLIGGLDLMVVNPFASSLLSRYKSLNEEYFSGETGQSSVMESGIWLRRNEADRSFVLKVGRVDTTQQTMHDVMILEYSRDDQLITRINANNGMFSKHGLELQDVWEFPMKGPPQHHREYLLKADFSLKDLQESTLSPDVLSFWNLPGVIQLMENSGLAGTKYRLHWHALLARSLWLMSMIIIAATCSLRPIRQGGTVLLILIGTVVGFMLYFLKDITYAMAQSGTLPFILAAWAPFGLSSLLGIAILLHIEDG